MTTLLGSKYWITTLLAAGALVAVSGCTASAVGDDGAAAPASSSPTAPDIASAGSTAAPTATTGETPSAAATPAASVPPGPTTSSAPPAASSAPQNSAASSSAPLAPATCTAAQLGGAVESRLGGGAAGSVYRTLRLTNISQADCTMAGYPGVSFVDAAGNQLGAPADRADAAVVPVTLAPGTSVSTTLQQTNAQNYGADCGLTQAAGVRVYPPGATDSLILPQDIAACSAGSIVLMTVGAVQPVG
ncbi:DUF4232 domain-containing protein [uncultured Arthrobacter sp.]|uniref:DUF4232 domain-containing protein n=1 Tax=uncultured Arthrobacter sp. TaxID=114050 RepID=UPI00261761A5|nr:DUF4232 domain-containing protein [uncultured Arthrobacter sp.]